MSNSGGFTVTRAHSGDRFYNPPAMRRQQQFLFQQQLQLQRRLQRRLQRKSQVDSVEAETLADSDEPTLYRPNSVCSASPGNGDLSNLDRLIDSVTPYVPVQYLPEVVKIFSYCLVPGKAWFRKFRNFITVTWSWSYSEVWYLLNIIHVVGLIFGSVEV